MPRKSPRSEIDLSSNWKRSTFSQRTCFNSEEDNFIGHLLYVTRASFAITSLCIGIYIYVYKWSMYARLHCYIDLDAVCVVVLYNRSTLHDVEHNDEIYSCPYVHWLYPIELRDNITFLARHRNELSVTPRNTRMRDLVSAIFRFFFIR